MKFKKYINEEIDLNKKKVRTSLKSQLQKIDSDIDKLIDNIEKEIDKIQDNPAFHGKVSQMLNNTEKECGEFLIALRQVITTLGRNVPIIPQVRGHAKGVIPDDIDKEESKIETKPTKDKDEDK